MSGKDLAPAHSVRLVRRPNGDNGTDLLGCVLPRGRVRKVTSSTHHETSDDTYRVKRVRGAAVLFSESSSNSFVSGSALLVFNIRSGVRYAIARQCTEVVVTACGTEPVSTASAVFINSLGQSAAAFAGVDVTKIVGFSSLGMAVELDSGPSAELPAGSLSLSGRTVEWTHLGQVRTATLSG